jgi:hypothetical protein
LTIFIGLMLSIPDPRRNRRAHDVPDKDMVYVGVLDVFFALLNLRHSFIDVVSFSCADYDFLKRIGSAWPSLQLLYFDWSVRSCISHSIHFRLEDITIFATQRCPQLQVFRLAASATLSPAYEALPQTLVRNGGLEELRVTIQSAHRDATKIVETFLKLTRID